MQETLLRTYQEIQDPDALTNYLKWSGAVSDAISYMVNAGMPINRKDLQEIRDAVRVCRMQSEHKYDRQFERSLGLALLHGVRTSLDLMMQKPKIRLSNIHATHWNLAQMSTPSLLRLK